ncbi:DegV domain-containing protein [Anaerolineales bacterium]|nr:DegV domain-containing protein [Anaerolineales bacterium]
MQIVTDTGMDMFLPPELMPEIPIHVVPHTITLDGKSYRSREDIQSDELQKMLMETSNFPITSQPSAGDFAEVYRKLAVADPDILSIQMSSGLSGTYNAARLGAEMVAEANVTVVDTKTLCAALGWQVAAAARALKAGWSLEKIVGLIELIGAATESIYTLDELKYLIHGGRISHMKGLLASMLKIRPLIGVEKAGGTYSQLGMARTFEKALQGLVDIMLKHHKPGSALRVQVLHSYNMPGAEALCALIAPVFKCTWMPIHYMSPALAAHTGPSMVGVAYAAADVFEGLP